MLTSLITSNVFRRCRCKCIGPGRLSLLGMRILGGRLALVYRITGRCIIMCNKDVWLEISDLSFTFSIVLKSKE